MRLWLIYIFPQSVCLFCWRKYVDRSWDYINLSQTHECGNWGWGRAIPRKGIHKWDFRCSAWKKKSWVYSYIVFCRKEKWRQKTRQKLVSEKTRVYAQKPWLKMPFKNSPLPGTFWLWQQWTMQWSVIVPVPHGTSGYDFPPFITCGWIKCLRSL